MNSTNIFRNLHAQPGQPLILANVWDAAGARLIESLGAKAVATTSAGVAWSKGYPDGNHMPSVLQASLAKEIVDAVKIPVSVDFEAGYSDDPTTVAENLRPLIDAGVSGINLEDGTNAPEILARKIEAIKKMTSAAGADIFINARTDVYLRSLVGEEERVRETLTRATTYRSAGADGLFAPAVTRIEDIGAIVHGTDLPLNVLHFPGLPKLEDLARHGVRRLSAGSAIAQSIYGEFARLARSFLAEGDLGASGVAMTFPELQSLFTGKR